MIIPAVNCSDFQSASKHIRIAERFLSPSTGWIHLDVADGTLNEYESWGDIDEFISLGVRMNVEVHLMMGSPDALIIPWLKAGAKRLIVPAQTIKNKKMLQATARKFGAEIVPSFAPAVSVNEMEKYLHDFDLVQILAVDPGPTGQQFRPETPERISFLRGKSRGVRIETDGGINLETAVQALEAGADVLVSSSYVFGDSNPSERYAKLEALL